MNPAKSVAIKIKGGPLAGGDLVLNDGSTIRSIAVGERLRYLGCTYENELVFDEQVIVKMADCMNKLLETPLLNRDQKLTILNTYILPKLTYPLQAAPIHKIAKTHLDYCQLMVMSNLKICSY